MKLTRSDIEQSLKSSFLNFLSGAEISTLAEAAQVLEVPSNQKVQRDEQPVHLYIVHSGSIAVRQRAAPSEVGRKEPGRSLELRTVLLRSQQWSFDWQAEVESVILKLPWPPVEAVLQKYPTQLQYLARMTQSVALQRFKRDLMGLNLSRQTVIELISRMRLELFTGLKPESPVDRMIVTVFTGQLVVQVEDNEKPFHLMTLAAGDSTFLDFSQTHLKYIPQEGSRVWVISEKEWLPLLKEPGFPEFLEIFQRKSFKAVRPQQKEANGEFLTEILRHKPVEAQPEFKDIDARYLPSNWARWMWRWTRAALPAAVDENRTGTAVLGHLLKLKGIKVRHQQIDENAPEERIDSTLERFQRKAAKVGMLGEIKPLSQMSFRKPVVVQAKNGFGLLYRKHPKHWTLGDLNSGQYRDIPTEKLSQELRSLQGFVPRAVENVFKDERKEFKFRHLFQFLRTDRKVLGLIGMASFFAFLADLALPVFSQYIIDQVVVGRRMALLDPLILTFAGLTVMGGLVGWYVQAQNNYLSNLLTLRMKAYFQASIFRMNPAAIHNMGASQLLTRISDIDQIAGFLVNQVFGSLLNLIFMIGNLTVLWIYRPSLVAMVLVLFPVGIGMTALIRSRLENLKAENVRSRSRENRLMLEQFSAPDDMKTIKGSLPARWKWDFNSHLLARNLVSNQKVTGAFQVVQIVGNEAMKMVVFFYCLSLYTRGQMSLGQVMAVTILSRRVADPIQGLVMTVFQYHQIKILVSRLNDLITPQNTLTADLDRSVGFDKSLVLDGVSLKLEKTGTRAVLKDLSFEVKMGETVAIVGGTGSGKTCLAYLLAGLYEADEGDIRIDGTLRSEIDPRHFFSRVALVEQEGRLFAGSILDNIALGEDRPDLEKAVRCAKAEIKQEVILARPGGFGSVLAHGGLGLSEGQKQRLLIARALYKEPKILILDECTSFLDPISEQHVMKNIFDWMKGRTVIAFTQRVQVTSKVSRVMLLSQGELVEQGAHRDLISRRKRYFQFYMKHVSIH